MPQWQQRLAFVLIVGAVGYTNMNAGKNERPGNGNRRQESEKNQGKISTGKKL